MSTARLVSARSLNERLEKELLLLQQWAMTPQLYRCVESWPVSPCEPCFACTNVAECVEVAKLIHDENSSTRCRSKGRSRERLETTFGSRCSRKGSSNV